LASHPSPLKPFSIPRTNYMLVFLSLTTMVCKTFMVLAMAFMDNEIRTFLVWMDLTLTRSNSISNWTTSLTVWKIPLASSWNLIS
jgi:hypothetical protein